MSTFKVSLTKIAEVWDHPDADLLILAKVEGMNWQFCSQKDLYEVGAEVVYFPVDSKIPTDLAEYLEVKKYLGGKDQDRLKTVKLRKQISQGLVIAVDTIKAFIEKKWPGLPWPPKDLTETLGIEKWEAPGVECKGAVLKPLPDGVSAYDIEGADNYPDVVELLMDRKVLVTEKLEGTNFSVTIMPDGRVMVNQRNYTIVPDGTDAEHTFWKAAMDLGYIDKATKVRDKAFPGQQVTLRGELIGSGIQGNIYGLEKKEVQFFDVLVDMEYLPVDTYLDVLSTFWLPSVPLLSNVKEPQTLREWLDGKTLQEASNGKSVIGSRKGKREGIVITPFQEDRHGEIGRLIIKQRSPEYLAKSDL